MVLIGYGTWNKTVCIVETSQAWDVIFKKYVWYSTMLSIPSLAVFRVCDNMRAHCMSDRNMLTKRFFIFQKSSCVTCDRCHSNSASATVDNVIHPNRALSPWPLGSGQQSGLPGWELSGLATARGATAGRREIRQQRGLSWKRSPYVTRDRTHRFRCQLASALAESFSRSRSGKYERTPSARAVDSRVCIWF